MPHLRVRAPRAGYALLLLPLLLGSASGAPAPDSAVPAATPARTAPAARPSADDPAVVAITLPCASGTCQVLIPAPPEARHPKAPSVRTAAAPQPLAQR